MKKLFQKCYTSFKNRIVDDQKNNKRNYLDKQNNFLSGWHFGVFTGKSVTVTGFFLSDKNVALQMHDAEKG